MTWLTPMVGAAAAAAAIPLLLILYFLKLRRRDLEVSSTLLWRKAIQDLQANAPFQRLRRNILLLLQLLALAAVLLALAQPQIAGGSGESGRFVILIDRSASMSATDAGAGREPRLDVAKREARAMVETMQGPGVLQRLAGGKADEAMVIAFDSVAEVRQSFTANKALLIAAIDAIEPTDAPTSLVEAARLSGAYARPVLVEDRGLVSAPAAPIHLWSDGAIPDLDRVEVAPDSVVTYHAVGGATTPNLAIVGLRAERAFNDPETVSIFVGVQNSDAQTQRVDVELAVDGVVSAIREVVVPGAAPVDTGGAARPSSAGVVFTLERAQGAAVAARLLADDALPADNRAWLALPPAKRASVALVTTGSLLVQSALEGLNLATLRVLSPTQFEQMVRREDPALGGFDVVVLDGFAPAMRLPAGRYLVLGAVPLVEGLSSGGTETTREPGVIVSWSREHPALRHANLDGLFVAEARPLGADKNVRTLASGPDGPLIVDAVSGAVRAIVVAFNPLDSNWPFDFGFVLFLADAVQTLAADPTLLDAESNRPGAPIVTTLPAGAGSVEVLEPSGDRTGAPVGEDGRLVFGPVRRAGMYALRWSGPAGPSDIAEGSRTRRMIAVNLLDAAESDLGTRPDLPLSTGSVRNVAASGDVAGVQRLWPWLLLGALALLLVEWWIYNRKVHV